MVEITHDPSSVLGLPFAAAGDVCLRQDAGCPHFATYHLRPWKPCYLPIEIERQASLKTAGVTSTQKVVKGVEGLCHWHIGGCAAVRCLISATHKQTRWRIRSLST
ncbi:hypothetical protein LIA77_02602 [Sarocladium implicatum]|nr:hypothetical protein LIA77_02602 [Sarocladium implicatum]